MFATFRILIAKIYVHFEVSKAMCVWMIYDGWSKERLLERERERKTAKWAEEGPRVPNQFSQGQNVHVWSKKSTIIDELQKSNDNKSSAKF